MRKIIIINEGEWGALKREDYDEWAAELQGWISGLERTDGRGQKEKLAQVMITRNSEEAVEEAKYASRPLLIFISRSMLRRAREVKSAHPSFEVMLFTGLIPEDEVVIVSKGWITRDFLKEIVS